MIMTSEPIIREIEVKTVLSKSNLPVSDYSVNPYVDLPELPEVQTIRRIIGRKVPLRRLAA